MTDKHEPIKDPIKAAKDYIGSEEWLIDMAWTYAALQSNQWKSDKIRHGEKRRRLAHRSQTEEGTE
jgi:hypothetical protein